MGRRDSQTPPPPGGRVHLHVGPTTEVVIEREVGGLSVSTTDPPAAQVAQPDKEGWMDLQQWVQPAPEAE